MVHSSLGDKGSKSAAATNPDPSKTDHQTLTKKKMHGAFKLISLFSGQLFGDEDVVNERVRTATATCVSHVGVVYKINAAEFLKRIEQLEETKIEFHKQLFSKQRKLGERSEMIEAIYNIKPKDILASIALEKAEGERVTEPNVESEPSPTQKSPNRYDQAKFPIQTKQSLPKVRPAQA